MNTPDLQAPHSPDRRLRGSPYFTRELAQRALRLAAPMIEQARQDRDIVGSGFLHVVIMDPAKGPRDAHFEDAILHEQSFGDRSQWDADYAAFAHAKARLSWSTGMDGRVLQEFSPHLLREGDTLLGGGICLDGIVVAASGAFPLYDEVFAGTVALWMRAIARKLRADESQGRVSL